MALPRISQTPTQYCVPRRVSVSASLPGSLSAKVYQIYPAYLPPAHDIPNKVNPLQPPPPNPRTVALETVSPHWNNAQRTSRMKEREYFRYHNAWSKYYYGSVAEQEAHNSATRSVLKQQMSDKWRKQRTGFFDRFKESEQSLNYDRKCRDEDTTHHNNKFASMMTYRDENKRMMDTAREERVREKTSVDQFDREQMRYNPINWSMTLK